MTCIFTPKLPLRKLLVFLQQLPPNRESALMRALDEYGEGEWDVNSYLLAILIDMVNHAIWMQTEDGHKKRNKPKPLERPRDVRAKQEKAKALVDKAARFQKQSKTREEAIQGLNLDDRR